MGADEKSILKKCGEILINLRMKNKKTKAYTFNCAYCETNFDQLKKFSQHLEDTHLLQLIDGEVEEKVVIFEPEIKIEVNSDIKTTSDFIASCESPKEISLAEDPLETAENNVDTSKSIASPIGVKKESETNSSLENKDDDEHNSSNDDMHDDMHFEDCFDDNEDEYEPIAKRIKTTKKSLKYFSDESSDEANNVDTTKKKKLKSVKQKKTSNQIKVNEEELIVALLEAFKKQPYLWSVEERAKDLNICQNGYETIANEVSEKLNTSLTGNNVKKRITDLRIEYSKEVEKQRKSEEFKMPWYKEHMDYLQENIDKMLERRHKKGRYKRWKKFNDAELSILIELYKKNEILWDVNNVAFRIVSKREEAYSQMIEELKVNHNFDITLEIFQDYIKYINRLFSKNKEQQLKCEMENREFVPSSKLYESIMFLSKSQGPFRCPKCDKIVQKYVNYHIHVAQHDNSMPFKCPLCEMGYKGFGSYLTHCKSHLGIYSFHCKVCGKGYHTAGEIDYHMTSHTGDKPYLCQVCGAGFRARHEHDNHIRRHEKRFRYECHICKQTFNHLHKFNDHVKSHLNIRDVICNICGKGFTAVKYLRIHKLIHEDKKRFKCEVCGKEFAQNAGLRQHRKQHQPHLTAAEKKIKNEENLSYLSECTGT